MSDLNPGLNNISRHSSLKHNYNIPNHRQNTPFSTLRLLSYNIQVGIKTSHYHHYLTHSWKHLLPHRKRSENLNQIAHLINSFDIVALQEADSGSFRSNFINQIEYLAQRSHFPYWYNQINRNLGRFAQHSNGLLSRYRAHKNIDHKLPGLLPGRGVMEVRFGPTRNPLVLLLVHLALSKRARIRQLEYIIDLINKFEHVIIMGDFNCSAQSEEIHRLLNKTHLLKPADNLHTYPSWQPTHNIDHIMVSSGIHINETHVLEQSTSDHLPIMIEITAPDHIAEYWQERYAQSTQGL